MGHFTEAFYPELGQCFRFVRHAQHCREPVVVPGASLTERAKRERWTRPGSKRIVSSKQAAPDRRDWGPFLMGWSLRFSTRFKTG